MSGRRIRVGIVGCGEATQILHLPSLRQLADTFEVVGLCDVDVEVVEGVGRAWGVEFRVTDYRQLLDVSGLDAVLIACPDWWHAEVTIDALHAGKHVLVEKPMCMDLSEADAIVEAERSTGLVVQVGYMRRYAKAFREMLQRVANISPVYVAVHDVVGRNELIIKDVASVIRPRARGDIGVQEEEAALARDRLARAAGTQDERLIRAYRLMLNLASHDVSAMRELVGMPRGVLCCAVSGGGSMITASFDYGDACAQMVAGFDDIPRFDGWIEVYGKRDVVRLELDTPYVRNLPHYVQHVMASKHGAVERLRVQAPWGDAFVEEWRAFGQCIREGTKSRTSPEDARMDLLLFQRMIGAVADFLDAPADRSLRD